MLKNFTGCEQKLNKYNLVVTGATGCGKSRACNFFFQNNVFNVAEGMLSLSGTTISNTTEIDGNQIQFTDCHCPLDAAIPQAADYLKEISNAIVISKGGVDAFALCIRLDTRFTKEDAIIVEELQSCEKIWQYMFVLFTHGKAVGDTEEQQRASLQQFLSDSRCPQSLRLLMILVNNRYILLESSSVDKDYHKCKSKELIKMMQTISVTTQKPFHYDELEQIHDLAHNAGSNNNYKDKK